MRGSGESAWRSDGKRCNLFGLGSGRAATARGFVSHLVAHRAPLHTLGFGFSGKRSAGREDGSSGGSAQYRLAYPASASAWVLPWDMIAFNRWS